MNAPPTRCRKAWVQQGAHGSRKMKQKIMNKESNQ